MKTQGCGKITPHPEHTFRDDWFFMFRKLLCPGVKVKTEKQLWQEANPGMEYIVDHKHHLKLTRWTWSEAAPWGKYDQICRLGFTCLEDECEFVFSTYRWKYDRLVLGNQPKEYGPWPT
jgi:hypothetical protein